MLDKQDFKKSIESNIKSNFGKTIENALDYEKYNAVSKAIVDFITDKWQITNKRYAEGKQAYYLSAEFLMGRALGNNLLNLGIHDEVKEVLQELDISIDKIEEIEEDAGLGNGGLGRLAACFLDSGATKNLPLHGYGIRYRYGIFKQKIIDGFQAEEGDNWLKYGDPWSIRRREDAVIVAFADMKVLAVPYDTPIVGYDTDNINTLRLWQAESLKEFDFNLFNKQHYTESVNERNKAEDISRALYPNDSKIQGKELRLRQQYFFTSASIQDLVRKFKQRYGLDFKLFPNYHAIQLNDTHPVVAIPEFIRILVDEENIEWEKALDIAVRTFSYTNHTIMAEALEKWDMSLFRKLLPRVYEIVEETDKRLIRDLRKKAYSDDKIDEMRIISDNTINMAWLAIYCCHTINGVAKLHTEILINQELKNWYSLYPDRFKNITNGITPRRWLALSNKELTKFISELLGTDKWIKDLGMLGELEKYKDDDTVIKKFLDIKQQKKRELSEYIKTNEGIFINPDSIFDIHIKRVHEYKRQLLNAFHILDLYYRLKENSDINLLPRTFIFGGKAAPGYFRAKGIIKFINEISKLVNNDKDTNEKLRVVYIQNYRVSYAEKLFPAADISEQISTVGKEASGTGNMKFMLNGALTLGTYDGANIEIVEEAGEENNFIFGKRAEDINRIMVLYDPIEYYNNIPGLKRVVDSLIDGTFDDGGTGMFKELYDSLLKGASWHRPDHYLVLRDFDDYRKAHIEVDKAYRDRLEWGKKCWLNLASAGKFSSDRTILEYATEIWKIDNL